MNNFTKKKHLNEKLISATILLVISGAMLVTSTYAWFVMSTAPEVSGIETQVGANGALEIALFDTDSYNDHSLLDVDDFDESADEVLRVSNLTWGNLVDLSDSSYGLNKIALLPSRLNISQNGTDDNGNIKYKVGEVLLKTPKYNEDGRVQGLVQTAFSSIYNAERNAFLLNNSQDYGVRAIGTSTSVSALQQALNNARNSISSSLSSARTKASNALISNGDAIANIAIMHALSTTGELYSTSDVSALKNLAEGLQESLLEIESGIKQLYIAYISSDNFDIEALNDENLTDYNKCVEYILNNNLSNLNEKFVDVIPEQTYITKFNTTMNTIETAINNCDVLINTGGSFTWAQIANCMSSLADYSKMMMNGLSIDAVQQMYENGQLTELVGIITQGIVVSVPDGSGILSDIAEFAGNYSAKVTITSEATVQGISINGMSATMATQTEKNPVYLTTCSNKAKKFVAGAGDETPVISDFYGYCIDLAFKTNAQDSNLLLATESINRIYDGDNNNENIQGGGSFMRFTSSAGLSATRMLKLMKAIRVVFVDENNNILAIGALDTTVGKDAYGELSEEVKIQTGKFFELNALSSSQLSDYITYAEYEDLQDESSVIFDPIAGTIEAKMYLYDYHMTVSETSTAEETKYTGGLTLDARKENPVITSLEMNEIKAISTIVYLDGSFVNNSMVAANSEYSLSGVMNLQFMSDANLIPAENSELRFGEDD